MEMVVKLTCQNCGKKKAIKTRVVFTSGDALITTIKGCYKCGWTPPNQPIGQEPPNPWKLS